MKYLYKKAPKKKRLYMNIKLYVLISSIALVPVLTLYFPATQAMKAPQRISARLNYNKIPTGIASIAKPNSSHSMRMPNNFINNSLSSKNSSSLWNAFRSLPPTQPLLKNRFNSTGSTYLSNVNVDTSNKRPIHISKLDGSYDKLAIQHKPLSPIHGAALIEGNFIRNIYLYGSPDHATTKLVNDGKYGLFFIRHDVIAPTRNKSNPAYALTPAITGQIISALESSSINQKEVQNRLINALRASYKQKTSSALPVIKAETFIKLIAQSANECHPRTSGALYIPRTTHMILLAHLYRSAENIDEIDEYVKNLPAIKQQQQKNKKNMRII